MICQSFQDHEMGRRAGWAASVSQPQACLHCGKTLEEIVPADRAAQAKAFGGCTKCYGKGYATTIQWASGKGESHMGQGDVEVSYKLPEMRFCSCERGKELQRRFAAQSDQVND